MVGLALFHFVLVELRPLITAGISTLSISRLMFQQAYRSYGIPSVCAPECSMQACLEENSNMLQSAMASFTREYNATGTCTKVGVAEVHKWYVSMFFPLDHNLEPDSCDLHRDDPGGDVPKTIQLGEEWSIFGVYSPIGTSTSLQGDRPDLHLELDCGLYCRPDHHPHSLTLEFSSGMGDFTSRGHTVDRPTK